MKTRKHIYIFAIVIMLIWGGCFCGRNGTGVIKQEISEEQKNELLLAALEEKELIETNKRPLAVGSAENGDECHVSAFIGDLQYIDSDESIEALKEYGVKTISVPLVWSLLEEKEGQFNPKEYDRLLAPYVEAGFHFIFIIDSGNRKMVDNDGNVVAYALPEWIRNNDKYTRQVDLLGNTADVYGLSYSDFDNLELLLNFCEQTVTYFGEKYKQSLVGFAVSIANEVEIKYPQTQYAFTDYSDDALSEFHKYLNAKYESIEKLNDSLGTSYANFESITFPLINYGNSITNGYLTDDLMFFEFMCFREEKLVDYVTPIYKLIKESGNKSVAYFGQTLCGHDAIYASAICTLMSDLADVAVIDFNFYNGYVEDYNSILPAMMVNYVYNAGYKEVWAGLYYERIPYWDYTDFLQETVDYIAEDGLASGFEIGGLHSREVVGKLVAPKTEYGIKNRDKDARIAIYVSKWNFYKDHGEKVRYFDYFTDAVSQIYKILRFELGYQVDILCDKAILDDKAQNYELLILPSQFYVDTLVKERIEHYLSDGGKALMDFRFGEWDANGNNTESWSDSKFYVGQKQSCRTPKINLIATEDSPVTNGGEFCLNSYYPGVPNLYYTYTSEDNKAKYLFSVGEDRFVGVYTQNTIVLGFQPQIQYRYAEDEADRESAVRIVEEAVSYLLS